MKYKSTLSIVFSAFAFALLPGCATLPSPEVMKAETASFKLPQTPRPEKALVYVVRPSSVGGLVRFNVFVDDQEANSEMGYTRGSQYIFFNVTPGTHRIYSKAENWADTEINVSSGDVVFIQQEPSMGIVMARNSVSKLDEVQGKYQVMKLQAGTIMKTDK